jgi:hypothetical protein
MWTSQRVATAATATAATATATATAALAARRRTGRAAGPADQPGGQPSAIGRGQHHRTGGPGGPGAIGRGPRRDIDLGSRWAQGRLGNLAMQRGRNFARLQLCKAQRA